jgi:hypothetical protein
MTELDRRQFVSTLVCTAAGVAMPPGAPSLVASQMEVARHAYCRWQAAFDLWRTCNRLFEVVEVATETGVLERFIPTAPTLVYSEARDMAQDAIETVLMTKPLNEGDDAIIMDALDLYAEIAPSSFAMTTARDMFTPERFQNYPLTNIRHCLLTDPDEDFEKTGIPGFLKVMRDSEVSLIDGRRKARTRAQSRSA